MTLHPLVLQGLSTFRKQSKLKRSLLYWLSTTLDTHEQQALRRTFRALDTDHSGTITVDELRIAVKALSESSPEQKSDLDHSGLDSAAVEMLAQLDADGDGKLSWEEIVLSFSHRKLVAKEERLYALFSQIDTDRSGRITADEMFRTLSSVGLVTSIEQVQQMMSDMDANGDGAIDLDELIGAFLPNFQPPSAQ